MGRYNDSAATLHSILAVGPGWDWATMIGLYPNVDTYTKQLRALENHVKSQPDDAAAHFALAYHYITTGHNADAVKNLQAVSRLLPNDRLAADLLKMESTAGEQAKNPAAQANVPPNPPAKPADAGPAIDAAKLSGSWNAKRDDGSTFQLALGPNKSFDWNYSQGDKKETLTGTYTTEGSLLILQNKDGGAMIGRVQPDGDNGMNFKLLGSPDDDPGLTFRR
ncbi:MAG: tetratricopeptide repeat protein [Pirellulales bacterium]